MLQLLVKRTSLAMSKMVYLFKLLTILNKEESEEDQTLLFKEQNFFNKYIDKNSNNESNTVVSTHN